MIQEHFDMSIPEKLSLIVQVFLKIAGNFWWVLLLLVVLGIIIRKQESAGKGINPRKRR
jgi:hypothetical protein